MDNAGIADRLDAFASLLELADANPYTARAYRRAAEMIRGAPVAVADLVRSGRVRELRGIGSGIEARLRELVETGEIAELAELERTLSPELIGLGRYLGLTARRAIEIAQALDIHTADELRAAAAEGRLRDVPGIGPKVEAQIVGALSREPEPRALLLNQASELAAGIAAALDGVVAGDVRRWRDACEHLAVVCAPEALERFAALPQIVAVIEHDERRAVGVTVEGVPVEAVAADPPRFGTALLRATGAPAYVAALEPLPDAPDEPSVYAAARHPVLPAGAARSAVQRRAAAARRGRRHPRRPALPHDVVGRARERGGDGACGPRPRLRVHRDLRPHAGGRRRPRAHPRRRPPPGRGDRRRQRGAGAVPRPARDRVRHPARRPARPPRRRARRARLGAGQRPRRPADAARAR